ncbi:hypothetical protein C2845_PM09G13710 [Panicum miliaceum]|uniref:Peptidase C1A papain C-terminal domain-containing protein n=1 Tax=Panicum miliaceum TaxID=4540 RepID=A0A3L6S3Q6_PANMI|nr:hypothetical protein C2845_PM09G13710 [Panicum miliaceum]
MADRKRKRGANFATTARGPWGLLAWLLRVRSRRAYRPPLPPPPSPSDSSSSTSSGVRSRRAHRHPPPPPPSPPDSSSSTSSEVAMPPPPPSPSDSSSSTSPEVAGARPSYPRPLLWGTRSIKQPKPWTCGTCGFKNALVHHLLFDLPPFKCKACDADPPEGSTDFGFCYGDLALNGFCPIGNVKDQTGQTCLANSLSSAVEMTHRFMKIIQVEPLSEEGPVVDVDDLLKKYKKFCGEGCENSSKFGFHALVYMLRILEDDGVKDMESTDVYKIYDWDYINEDDFAALSSALADGYPLLTGIQLGKRFWKLEPGDLYMPPKEGSIGKDGKSTPEGHAVLLVGAQQEQGIKFFYFLNSWSEEFCPSIFDGDGILGGIGAVRAEGIGFSPLQILRFGERSKQEVHHPQ